jgi:hypothetical protein
MFRLSFVYWKLLRQTMYSWMSEMNGTSTHLQLGSLSLLAPLTGSVASVFGRSDSLSIGTSFGWSNRTITAFKTALLSF